MRSDVPLHIPSFRPSKGQNTVLGENIQTKRVDAFLIDDYEVFLLLLSINGLITNKVLEFDDLLDLCIRKSTLGLDEFFALFSRRIEEPRVYLARVFVKTRTAN
jgi:hypothetical protein